MRARIGDALLLHFLYAKIQGSVMRYCGQASLLIRDLDGW